MALDAIELLAEQILGLEQSAATQADFNTLLAGINAIGLQTQQLPQQISVIENGLQGLAQHLNRIDQQLTTLLQQLSFQVGSPQQEGQPVTLPASLPPVWSSQGAAAVWEYELDITHDKAYVNMNALGAWLHWFGDFGNTIVGDDFLWGYVLRGDFTEILQASYSPSFPPAMDPSTIIASDTDSAAWFGRVNPTVPFTLTLDGYAQVADPNANTFFWVFRVTPAEFDVLKAQVTGALAPPVTPPVWPGLANVTLGTALTLSDGLLVPGPLDGVIVSLTSVPYPQSYYPFGPLKSFTKVGALTFVDDNGQAEFAQSMGMDAGIVVPKTMEHADHAYVRLLTGVVGTIQPWSVA